MWNLLINAVIKYVESHPEVLADLIDQATKAGIDALKAHNAAKA